MGRLLQRLFGHINRTLSAPNTTSLTGLVLICLSIILTTLAISKSIRLFPMATPVQTLSPTTQPQFRFDFLPTPRKTPTATPQVALPPTSLPASPLIFRPTPGSTKSPTPTLIPTSSPASTRKIAVLVLRYFPLKNGGLDPDLTGISDSLDVTRAKVETITSELIAILGEGSTYHQFKDNQSIASLHYEVIDTKEFLEAIPLSNNQVPWNPGIFRPDYDQILANLDICNYVENLGVKEVWMWGYHYGNLEPCESNMAGPYGDISNSEKIDDMPKCAKTYTLYNYNYGRDTAEALEDHMHQFEAVFKYVDYALFWNDFVRPYGSAQEVNGCGWAHYPPNGKSDYDWANKEIVQTDCEDWKPGGGGEVKQVNCERWNCRTVDFFKWWMQNIPGVGNELGLRSWWDFIADFDEAVVFGRTLI